MIPFMKKKPPQEPLEGLCEHVNPNNGKGQLADVKLVSRAVREGWPIATKHKKTIVERLIEVVQKTEVSVPSKDGPQTCDGPSDRNAVAAAAVLKDMEKQNQDDYWKQNTNERLDAGKVTERVDLPPMIVERPVPPPQGA